MTAEGLCLRGGGFEFPSDMPQLRPAPGLSLAFSNLKEGPVPVALLPVWEKCSEPPGLPPPLPHYGTA